jgi:hypothetical protein
MPRSQAFCHPRLASQLPFFHVLFTIIKVSAFFLVLFQNIVTHREFAYVCYTRFVLLTKCY